MPSFSEHLPPARTVWKDSYRSVAYEISLGKLTEDANAPITWLSYILIPTQMYPTRWKDFQLVHEGRGTYKMPPALESVSFPRSVSYLQPETYYDPRTGLHWARIRLGFDYYCGATSDIKYDRVMRDVHSAIDALLQANPDYYVRNEFSGAWEPNTEQESSMQNESSDFVRSLRALADAYEANPNMLVPSYIMCHPPVEYPVSALNNAVTHVGTNLRVKDSDFSWTVNKTLGSLTISFIRWKKNLAETEEQLSFLFASNHEEP